MGTRAAFWIGDPRNLDARDWLGAKAWDGYPENPALAAIMAATTPEAFRSAVADLAEASPRDFALPSGGWPYPWADDIFLTDYTYAFFGDKVMATRFHCGFIPVSDHLMMLDESPYGDIDDPTLRNVPAPKEYDRSQPDSIMILSVPR